MKYIYIYLIFFIAFLVSCNNQKEVATTIEKQQVLTQREPNIKKHYVNIDSIKKLVSIAIEEDILNLDTVHFVLDNQNIFSRTLLPTTYKDNEYLPLWQSEKNKNDAINALEKSEENGLSPKDYHLEKIEYFNKNYDKLTPEEKAEFDILLTDGVILYAYHLIKGKINPHDLSFSWNFIEHQLPENTKAILKDALKNENLIDALNNLEPQDQEYKLLKDKLAFNKQIIENGGWGKVSINTPLKPDAKDKGIVSLRKRLTLAGYLKDDNFNNALTQPDSVNNDSLKAETYNKSLVLAVKHFQSEHGLNSDGVIGKHTLEVINTPIEDYQKKIICNLERRRWIKYPTDEPYIKVNIADFNMQFIENNKVVYKSSVVIGKVSKKTPLFTKRMKVIVLNPTWTLPRSITTTETLRKLKQDPLYLEKHNMHLIDSKGNIISDKGIDWHKYKTGHFPYSVRQEPGPHNALGQVKFLFPNKYAIYLHDTPSKYLFSKEVRAFSHGCVRLQNPLDFADFLLERENKNYWNREKINDIIKTAKINNIYLKHKYPVLIMYQTTGASLDGDIFYVDDIYGRDNKLYKKITSSK